MQVTITNNKGIVAERIDGGRFVFGDEGMIEEKALKVENVRNVNIAALETPEASALWEVAQNNGWVDEQRMPLVSQPKAAILASVMADALNVKPRWAPFEELWGIPDLANKLSHAENCKYYPDTLKEYEKVLI